MKTEKEIKELYDIVKPIKTILHPSMINFVEWVLEIGDKEEQKDYIQILKGMSDAHKRNEKNRKQIANNIDQILKKNNE